MARGPLSYEAAKLRARVAECQEAFEALAKAADECSEAILAVESGSGKPEEALAKLSAFLDALSHFEHELSHLSESASTILAKLFGRREP